MDKKTKLLVDTTTFDCITYQDDKYNAGVDLLKYGATRPIKRTFELLSRLKENIRYCRRAGEFDKSEVKS